MRRWIITTAIVALLVVVGLRLMPEHRSNLEKAVNDLASQDISVTRQAQNIISDAGSEAVPQLLAVIQGPKNDNQKALAYYLIGDADPVLYGKLLLQAEIKSPGEFFPAFRYVNSEGLKNLPAERVREIKQTFLRCKGRIEKPEEAEAINDLLQSIH